MVLVCRNNATINAHDKTHKFTAVAEMGDRLATIDMDQNWGLCPFGEASWVPI